MSGFGIITGRNDAPDLAQVDRLQSGIRSRGRDAFTNRDLGDVVLVHAQFATTLEAQREVQPTRHVRRDVWLTADARIDNRDDLRRDLAGAVDHPLDTDADFILAAYECWGDQLAQHLLGDFAFGIWDAEREQLLLVRDHLGIRPVYWSRVVEGGVVASSTLRATLEASGQSSKPDPVYLANFATFSGADQEHSPWSEVRRLPGGHCLVATSNGQIRTWRYWNPPDDYLDVSVEVAATQVRSLFTEAVSCRLRAPSPIGIELSGGFDSTTVAAVAGAAIDHRELITYALTFPGQECDESAYIEAAEDHLQLRARRLDALGAEPYDFVSNCRSTLDIPLLPDTQWNATLLQLAVADGCRVVLTGQGGDHALFGDLSAVADDLLEQGERRAAWLAIGNACVGRRAQGRALARGMVYARVSRHGAGLAARVLLRRSRSRQARQEQSARMFLGPELWDFVSSAESRDAGRGRFRRARTERRNLYTGVQSYFIGLWDQLATDSGIEYRHPFLDVRVIEFVCRLGEDVIADDGRVRGLHRRAFGDLLPERTRDRRDKAEFSEPWIDAAMAPAGSVCNSDNESLSAFINKPVLKAHTPTCSTEPSPAFNVWRWWGAVAVGLWSLNCSPEPCDGQSGRVDSE